MVPSTFYLYEFAIIDFFYRVASLELFVDGVNETLGSAVPTVEQREFNWPPFPRRFR